MDEVSGTVLIDRYIEGFSGETRAKLEEIREIVRSEAPEASERMAYRMPTYYLHGNLVHFAGYAKHIGFYPAPSGISNFASELACYKNAKGSVQFPLDKPLPVDLIRRMVRMRVEENKALADEKIKRKRS